MIDGLGKLEQVDFIKQKTDTIWLRLQVNLPDTLNQGIDYTIIYDEAIIDSGEVVISDVGIQNLYYLPIPFTQHKRGKYKSKKRDLHRGTDFDIKSFGMP